jgi:hypothetical protein
VEQYLDKLQKVFKRVMDQDALSPHVKFLWVIERLQERWQGIKNGKSTICRSGGKSTPLSETLPPQPPNTSAGVDLKPRPPEIQPQAQGLHLLSEAAMGNQHLHPSHPQQNGNPNDPNLLAHPQPQQWYPQPAMNLPMDPNAYLFAGGLNGYDTFDYGLGVLGSGMDGTMAGLFMPDAMWGFGNQPDPNNPQHGGFGQW